MMQLPMIGTSEKTENSQFQITLVDTTDHALHPMDYPRIHRFFDTIADRNLFLQLFETTILTAGGKLVHEFKQSHPLFESFSIYDHKGNLGHEITVYR